MFEFHITGFAAAGAENYYYSSNNPVDITVNAKTKTEALKKAEDVLGHVIHKNTMKIVIKELYEIVIPLDEKRKEILSNVEVSE